MSSYKLEIQGLEEKFYIPSNFQNLDQLLKYIKSNIKDCPSSFELKYKDSDSDLISLSNDQALKECPKGGKIFLYPSDDSFELVLGENEQFELVKKESSFKATKLEDQYSMFYPNGISKPDQQHDEIGQVKKPVISIEKPVISIQKLVQQIIPEENKAEIVEIQKPVIEKKPKPAKVEKPIQKELSPEESLAVQLKQFFGKKDTKYYENFTKNMKNADFDTITQVIVKCEQISQVMDNESHKYINVVLKMDKNISIEDIIGQLLSETQLSQSTFPQYSPEIQEKAIILAQLLNKKPKELFEFCKAKKDTEVNELIELCFTDPSVLTKYQ